MPQTRFVLKKALMLGLFVIVVVNKVDRENQIAEKVADDVLELMIDLEADESYLESPIIYTSAKAGWASTTPKQERNDLKVLFDTIITSLPAPTGEKTKPLQMLVSNIEYDEYTGRLAIGKIQNGTIHQGQTVYIAKEGTNTKTGKVANLSTFEGLSKQSAQQASTGEIVAISGISDITIGQTLLETPETPPLPFVEIDKPVLSMQFSVNTSPFAGREGQYVTSRHLGERLKRELLSNISLTVEDTDSTDAFKVSGRGELHLSILIENMRREGYEFMVSKPKVITKRIDGVLCEPFERAYIDVDSEYSGAVIESISRRKGELASMTPTSERYTKLEFLIPSRGLIGYRSELLTLTKGTAVINCMFEGYLAHKGAIPARTRGSLIAWEEGESITYGLYNAQERGTLFIGPGVKVYEGMVVGENSREDDMVVNVCKRKHVTNMRAAGSDDALRLTPPRQMSLEQCLEFLADDELLEVTPENLRIRKRILQREARAKASHHKQNEV